LDQQAGSTRPKDKGRKSVNSHAGCLKVLDTRRAIRPAHVLSYLVPLPPLDEQDRIVARLTNIATLGDAISTLSSEVEQRLEQLLVSVHLESARQRTKRMSDLLELYEDRALVVSGQSYPQVGVRAYGLGLFRKESVAASETTYRHFNRLYDGCLVLSQVKGWEGAVAVCNAVLDGFYVSPEYRTFRCKENELSPRYLARLVRSKWFWSKLSKVTRGVGARRERTRPEQFLELEIEMPDAETQDRLLQTVEQIGAAAALRSNKNELIALKAAALRTFLP
jgi:type I restriction enzyme S subunit